MKKSLQKFMMHPRIKLDIVYQGPTFTVVRAWVSGPISETYVNPHDGTILDSLGIAQLNVVDKPDEFRAYQIASARAIKSLYVKVFPDMKDLVKTHVYRKL